MPRRKEAIRAPPTQPKSIVGRLIRVTWPADGTEYDAIVLSKGGRYHKVLYLDEESTENIELGTKHSRPHEVLNHPSDPLIGCDIKLEDPESVNGAKPWFDGMRPRSEKKSRYFIVKVFAIVNDPFKEEIVGPDEPDGSDSKYYRVIHESNEYLATINMSAVKYTITKRPEGVESIEEIEDDQKKDVIEVDERPSDEVLIPDDEIEQKVLPVKGKRTKKVKEAPDPDLDIQPVSVDNDLLTPSPKAKSKHQINSDPDARPSKRKEVTYDDEILIEKKVEKDVEMDVTEIRNDDDDDVIEADESPAGTRKFRAKRTKSVVISDKRTKSVSADQPSDHGALAVKAKRQINLDDDLDLEISPNTKSNKDDDNENEPIVKRRSEESAGTAETKDDPIEKPKSKKRKQAYSDNYLDEIDHDTASDEETLGWVSRDQKSKKLNKSQTQVGDYIALRTDPGGVTRNAFVEAYLPATGTHFVAFCDSKGGNLQVKLTKDNHVVYKEDEVDALNRGQSIQVDPDVVEPDVDADLEPVEEILDDDESPQMDTRRSTRNAKKRGRKQEPVKPLKVTRGKKRQVVRRREIIGRPAGKEICGRCVSIVWPGPDGRVYVALVLGFSSEKREHQVVYMADHCVETLDLRYREWSLVPRDKEPWITTGMIGKRLYVFWNGVYDDSRSQEMAVEVFGENTRIPYEAYVLDYVGEGKYKIIYPATEDTEVRELRADGPEDVDATEKEWDLLEEGVDSVGGLPLIGWTD